MFTRVDCRWWGTLSENAAGGRLRIAGRAQKQKRRLLIADMIDTPELQMVGLGTLSKNAAGGRLRIAVRAQKQKLSAKAQKKAKQYAAHGTTGTGAVSGLSSSLAFTPVQASHLLATETHSVRSHKLLQNLEG